MVESFKASENKADSETKFDAPIMDKSLHLCMVGVDKHWIEKDVIKFLRKSFALKD